MRAFWAAHVRWLVVLALVPLAALPHTPPPAAAGLYSISGRVTDSHGDPIVDVDVTDGAGHTARTDSSGAYVFAGLDPAAYQITPTKAGYTFSPSSISGTLTSDVPQDFTGTPVQYRVYLPLTYRPYDLKNGDFESGLDPWQRDSGSKLEVGVSTGDYRSPTHSLLLGSPDYRCEGGVPVGFARVTRTIEVPNASGVTVSFWYRVVTQDRTVSTEGAPLDTFEFALGDAAPLLVDGNRDQPASRCGPTPVDLGWKYFEASLDSYRGQPVTLSFAAYSREPGSAVAYYNTYVYVDDVSVNVR